MRDETKRKNEILRQKLFRMVSVGVVDEPLNRAYDVISTVALVVNLLAAFLNTFDYLVTSYRSIFADIEAVTVAFFAIDYVLRMYTAKYLYPGKSEPVALLRYFISFAGVIDLLSFLPYYLPVFFPAGAAAFRMFRVARIMRLFRINAYYDSLNVITEVLAKKKQQLLSSVFILAVLILASSLGMYSLEHEAQPEVFQNG
ncbi:MAG: ion transporter, partial [Lachnospiraceae bacterium]|nr:ion transporter [Lachnospiraceae bacterium]